jgi:hypothetical protein
VRPGSRLDGSRASSTTFQLCIKALGRRHGFSAWFLQLSRRSEQEKVRCESVSECSNSSGIQVVTRNWTIFLKQSSSLMSELKERYG